MGDYINKGKDMYIKTKTKIIIKKTKKTDTKKQEPNSRISAGAVNKTLRNFD